MPSYLEAFDTQIHPSLYLSWIRGPYIEQNVVLWSVSNCSLKWSNLFFCGCPGANRKLPFLRGTRVQAESLLMTRPGETLSQRLSRSISASRPLTPIRKKPPNHHNLVSGHSLRNDLLPSILLVAILLWPCLHSVPRAYVNTNHRTGLCVK